jgi:hypothetical protein
MLVRAQVLNMNFHDTVAPLIYNPDKRPLHDYLRAEGLLANDVDCQHCQQPILLSGIFFVIIFIKKEFSEYPNTDFGIR